MDSASPGCLPFVAASAAAAFAAPFAFDMTEIFVLVFIVGLFVASLHIVFLAMPIYLWLERKYRPTLAIVLPASALIGTLPAFLMSVRGNAWREIAEVILACGLCGIAGGLAFWLTSRGAGPAPPPP